jgi:hypothetical protein
LKYEFVNPPGCLEIICRCPGGNICLDSEKCIRYDAYTSNKEADRWENE